MPRSTAEILAHADELAQRFEQDYQPAGDPEPTPLGEVYLAVQRHAEATRALTAAVRTAHASGTPWRVLGLILGISGQAANLRFSEPAKVAERTVEQSQRHRSNNPKSAGVTRRSKISPGHGQSGKVASLAAKAPKTTKAAALKVKASGKPSRDA